MFVNFEILMLMICILSSNLYMSLITYTLEIRNNSQLNGLNVPDASLVSVKCTQDVLDLMRIGQRNRAVGATALNVRSSRSHRYCFSPLEV